MITPTKDISKSLSRLAGLDLCGSHRWSQRRGRLVSFGRERSEEVSCWLVMDVGGFVLLVEERRRDLFQLRSDA